MEIEQERIELNWILDDFTTFTSFECCVMRAWETATSRFEFEVWSKWNYLLKIQIDRLLYCSKDGACLRFSLDITIALPRKEKAYSANRRISTRKLARVWRMYLSAYRLIFVIFSYNINNIFFPSCYYTIFQIHFPNLHSTKCSERRHYIDNTFFLWLYLIMYTSLRILTHIWMIIIFFHISNLPFFLFTESSLDVFSIIDMNRCK